MKRTYRYDEASDTMTATDVRCPNEEQHQYLSVTCKCGAQPEKTQKLYTGLYA